MHGILLSRTSGGNGEFDSWGGGIGSDYGYDIERSRIQYHSPHNDDHADHNDTNDAIVHCGKNSNTSSSTKLDDTVILTDEELMELAGYLMEQPLHNHDDMMTTRNNSNTNNTTTMMPLRYVTRRHNHNSNK